MQRCCSKLLQRLVAQGLLESDARGLHVVSLAKLALYRLSFMNRNWHFFNLIVYLQWYCVDKFPHWAFCELSLLICSESATL